MQTAPLPPHTPPHPPPPPPPTPPPPPPTPPSPTYPHAPTSAPSSTTAPASTTAYAPTLALLATLAPSSTTAVACIPPSTRLPPSNHAAAFTNPNFAPSTRTTVFPFNSTPAPAITHLARDALALPAFFSPSQYTKSSSLASSGPAIPLTLTLVSPSHNPPKYSASSPAVLPALSRASLTIPPPCACPSNAHCSLRPPLHFTSRRTDSSRLASASSTSCAPTATDPASPSQTPRLPS